MGTSSATARSSWSLSAEDAWANPILEDEGTFTVDTVAPSLGDGGLTPAAGEDLLTFSPNGDGYRDTVSIRVSVDEPSAIEASMRDATDADVVDLDTSAPSGSATITWNGRLGNGNLAMDGVYQLRVVARDAAGNRSAPASKSIGVHKALVASRVSTANFWPNDGDAYATTITLAFDLLATRTVTWRVLDAVRERRPDDRPGPGHGGGQAHLRMGRPELVRRLPPEGDVSLGRDGHERHTHDDARGVVRAGPVPHHRQRHDALPRPVGDRHGRQRRDAVEAAADHGLAAGSRRVGGDDEPYLGTDVPGDDPPPLEWDRHGDAPSERVRPGLGLRQLDARPAAALTDRAGA